ncbi:MAG: TonB-dependent receptor, partial [Cytophagales bacterium]|nr:TonB-dependent receptor [Cytophagales bacterium]
MPAKYGGRLSSVLDVKMSEGNNQDYHAKAGVGLIMSRLSVEGPIVKDRSSFIVSGRRSYFDVFLALSPNEGIRNNILYFYDLNAKTNYRFDDNNRIYLSGYFGRDKLGFADFFGIDWGNATGTLRWNHLFNDRLFLNTSVIYSDYDYGIEINTGNDDSRWVSGQQVLGLKLDFDYYPSPKHTLSYGYQAFAYRFAPGEWASVGQNSTLVDYSLIKKAALEQSLYIGDEFKASPKLNVQYGARLTHFMNTGKTQVYSYSTNTPMDTRDITDTTAYDWGEPVKSYFIPEPRLALRYKINELSSIKASYNRNAQFLQVASTSSAGLPIDKWIPADRYIQPLIGDQVALGYFRNLFGSFEGSVEVYYKHMENVADFRSDADLFQSDALETEILTGFGWAYGLELSLEKNVGKTTGQVSYTLSDTRRKIEGINLDIPYSPRYNRPHNFTMYVLHQITPRMTASLVWTYQSGVAVSFPSGGYVVTEGGQKQQQGNAVAVYEEGKRNAYRFPAYHRLDLSMDYDFKSKLWGMKQNINVSVYNVYGRNNPFTYSFSDVYNNDLNAVITNPGEINTRSAEAIRTTLLGVVLPSISYNLEF